MRRGQAWFLAGAALATASACGSAAERRALPDRTQAEAGSRSSDTGRSGDGGTAGNGGTAGASAAANGGVEDGAQAGAGAESGGQAGAGAESNAGDGAGGAAGSQDTLGGAGGSDATPPPIPVCERQAGWSEGSRLSLSTPDNDHLQGVTPDGLVLVFEAAGHFYVAERSSADTEFGEPVEVAAGLGFSSLSPSADGLRLVGATAGGFAAITRATRSEAFGNVPDDADFVAFNAAVLGTPTNETAVEPLLALDDTRLLYSFVSASNQDERPTLYSSEWLGQWSFGQPLPGIELLWSEAEERRIATGISSDGLTLFYRDEVKREFRSAWRERLDDEFGHYASLGDLYAAAPDGNCARLYYSAESDEDGGLDLFVAEKGI